MILYPESLALRKLPKNLIEQDKILFETELSRKINATFLKRMGKVLINHDLVLFNGLHIYKESFTNAQYLENLGFVGKTKFLLKNFVFRKYKKFNRPAIWIIDAWSSNYFHCLLDMGTRLWAIRNDIKNFTILLPQHFNKYSYISDFLKLFTDNFVFVPENEIWEIQDLYFVSHTAPTGNYNELIIKELNQFFLEKDFKNNIDFGQKIYISRKNAPKRKLLNEEKLEKILEKYHIKSIILENYTWKEQVSILKKSNFLMGIHGAGLSNMLFMPPKSQILEIRGEDDRQNNAFFSLASALDFDYFYQLSKTDNSELHRANFELDLGEIELLLDKIF